MEFISPAVIIILGCVTLLLFLQWKNLRGPPCIGGWIPWIGAGFEFGKAPLEFIEKARIKVCGLSRLGFWKKQCFVFFSIESQVQFCNMGSLPAAPIKQSSHLLIPQLTINNVLYKFFRKKYILSVMKYYAAWRCLFGNRD